RECAAHRRHPARCFGATARSRPRARLPTRASRCPCGRPDSERGETRFLREARAPSGAAARSIEAGEISSYSFDDLLYRADHPLEFLALSCELLPTGGCQRIVTGTPVILGGSPFGVDPAIEEQTLKSRVYRPCAD